MILSTIIPILLGISLATCFIGSLVCTYNLGRLYAEIEYIKERLRILQAMPNHVDKEFTEDWYKGVFWLFKQLK